MGKRPRTNRPPARSSPPPAILAHQGAALTRRYPHGQLSGSRVVLVWSGAVTPAQYSDTYELVISHQLTGDAPLVYIARPRLQLVPGMPLPHVYPLNTLCLYHGQAQWNSSMLIADTLVPWAAEWLIHYEVWLATQGNWTGGGVHTTSPIPAQREKTESVSQRQADHLKRKAARLESALRTTYGATCDLEELLYNSRLSPQPASPEPVTGRD